MSCTSFLNRLAGACRVPAGFLFAAVAVCALWTGFGLPGPLPGSGTAVAESEPPDPSAEPGGMSADAALYLRSSVDAAALALRGALANGGIAKDRRGEMLAASLGDLTFKLGGAVYFTAWQGTRVLHSPMSPDAEGMDFAGSLDARGVAFVGRMEEAALAGGGFVRVLLPEAPVGPRAPGPVVSGVITAAAPEDPEAVAYAGGASPGRQEVSAGAGGTLFDEAFVIDAAFCPHGESCPVSTTRAHRRDSHGISAPEPVEQVVYVRPVSDNGGYIAAFMPLDASGDEAARMAETLSSDAQMKKGLRLSGLSLAGLAGLLLVPGGMRGRD